MIYIHIDAPQRDDAHPAIYNGERCHRDRWYTVAVPAHIAFRLLDAQLISVDEWTALDDDGKPRTSPHYAACTLDWAGDWLSARDLVCNIPGAFLLR